MCDCIAMIHDLRNSVQVSTTTCGRSGDAENPENQLQVSVPEMSTIERERRVFKYRDLRRFRTFK